MMLIHWLFLLPFVATNLLQGWLIGRFFALPPRWPTRISLWLLLGTALNGVIGVILAEFGRFSLANFAYITSTIALILYLWPAHVTSPPPHPLPRHHWAWLLWLPLGLWLFGRPHEFTHGAADAGVYLNLGASIANTGAIQFRDPALASLQTDLYRHFLITLSLSDNAPYNLLPGFYIEGRDGLITPQFYPLAPVYNAIGYALGGHQSALLVTGLWALLSVLLFSLIATRINNNSALGGGLILLASSLHALQIWFGRYPTTETLTQFWVWGGLWALYEWLTGNHNFGRVFPFTAGVCMGMAQLTRIDTFFLLALIPLIALILHQQHRLNRTFIWFALPFGALMAHTLAHAWWQSRPYFLNTFDAGIQRLLYDWWLAPATLIALLLTLILLRALLRSQQWSKSVRLAKRLTIITTILLASYAWFIRPLPPAQFPSYTDFFGNLIPILDSENFLRLGWYFSPIGILFATIAVCWWVWIARPNLVPILFVGLLFTLLYVWRLQNNFHQPYAMRRFVPITLPFFLLATASGLTQLLQHHQRHWRVSGMVAAALWLGGLGWSARGFISQVDFVGATAQYATLNQQLAPHAILLFDDETPFGQGGQMGTALRFLFGHSVFIMHKLDELPAHEFEAQLRLWQAENRPIYWLQTSANDKWPLNPTLLHTPHPYDIQFSNLEGSYDHKPTAILTTQWQGTLYTISPLP